MLLIWRDSVPISGYDLPWQHLLRQQLLFNLIRSDLILTISNLIWLDLISMILDKFWLNLISIIPDSIESNLLSLILDQKSADINVFIVGLSWELTPFMLWIDLLSRVDHGISSWCVRLTLETGRYWVFPMMFMCLSVHPQRIALGKIHLWTLLQISHQLTPLAGFRGELSLILLLLQHDDLVVITAQ